MKLLHLCILLVSITLVYCLPEAQGQSSDIDRILSHFSGYHVLTLRERDTETRAFIVRHFPKNNPSIVHADFDGDGQQDYAILLKSNKSGTTKLVFLLCSAGNHCKSLLTVDVTSDFPDIWIRPVPIGSRISQTDAIDTPTPAPPVILRSTGIEVTYFGKAKVVYYWNRKHKRIETVQTED